MPTEGTCFGTPKFICCRFLPQRTRQQHERCSNTATTHFRPLGKKRARQVIEAQCTRGNLRILAKRSRRQLPLLRWEKCFLFGTAKWKSIFADIAYGIWQYWKATGDDSFMLDFGAEIILESARFWAGRGSLEADGLYHIRHVIGPDEYHEDVDDNAFTNLMAAWNLRRAAEIANLLENRWIDRWSDLRDRLHLTASEVSLWPKL